MNQPPNTPQQLPDSTQQRGQRPPEWALEPVTAWIYLAAVIILAFTPIFPLNWVMAIIAAIFTYQDRKIHGRPTFWWTAAVLVFGAFAYVFFVYKRPKGTIVYPPNAVISQQARVVQGRAPLQQSPAGPNAAEPGWYSDPKAETRLRYWNGSKWTDHTAD
jgi:energy-coupling factor transporter transmembrane protein EcfT